MEVEEAYRVLQANCGIEEGDTVRVVRGAPDNMAYSYHDCSSIASYVGQIATVSIVVPNWIMIKTKDDLSWNTPFFCLELVEKAKPELPPILVSGNEVKFISGDIPRIEVCGILVHKETLKQILERLEN